MNKSMRRNAILNEVRDWLLCQSLENRGIANAIYSALADKPDPVGSLGSEVGRLRSQLAAEEKAVKYWRDKAEA